MISTPIIPEAILVTLYLIQPFFCAASAGIGAMAPTPGTAPPPPTGAAIAAVGSAVTLACGLAGAAFMLLA